MSINGMFNFGCIIVSLLSLFSILLRAGSGYPNGYPVLGNSQGGFPLPSSRFVITYCDQGFPSPWQVCPRHPPYPVLPSRPLSRAFSYPQPGDAGGHRSAPDVCQSLTSADPIVILLIMHTVCFSSMTKVKVLRRTQHKRGHLRDALSSSHHLLTTTHI